MSSQSELKNKPRTYRRKARKEYLSVSKKKRKTKQEIRKAIGKQLRYVKRNLSSIEKLLDSLEYSPFPLNKRDQKIYWVIQHIYAQQQQMYVNKTNQTQDRIVNIYQPYVRPIVRGKDKVNVEFGSKLSVSEYEGMSKVDYIRWDANESKDLPMQVEQYRKVFGCYPELVLADKIYLNRENRKYLKERNIRIVGNPLGRTSKKALSPYQKRKQRKERNARNHIEGKFGQGKNAYGLSNIRAKRHDTSESWISAIFFVMNLINLVKVAGKYLTDNLFLSFFYTCFSMIGGKSIFFPNLIDCYTKNRLSLYKKISKPYLQLLFINKPLLKTF